MLFLFEVLKTGLDAPCRCCNPFLSTGPRSATRKGVLHRRVLGTSSGKSSMLAVETASSFLDTHQKRWWVSPPRLSDELIGGSGPLRPATKSRISMYFGWRVVSDRRMGFGQIPGRPGRTGERANRRAYPPPSALPRQQASCTLAPFGAAPVADVGP